MAQSPLVDSREQQQTAEVKPPGDKLSTTAQGRCVCVRTAIHQKGLVSSDPGQCHTCRESRSQDLGCFCKVTGGFSNQINPDVCAHLCCNDTFIFLVRHDVDRLVYCVSGTLVLAVTGTVAFSITGRVAFDVTGRLVRDITSRLVLDITSCVTVQITG